MGLHTIQIKFRNLEIITSFFYLNTRKTVRNLVRLIVRMLMKHNLLVLMLLVAFYSQAQINIIPDTTIVEDSLIIEEDSIPVITWQKFKIQPYFAATYEVAPTPEGLYESLGGEIGFIYNNHWIAGAFGLVYQGEYTQRLVFPNDFELEYQHGGFFLGYTTDSEKRIDLSFVQKVSFGDVLWQYQVDDRDFIKDDIVFINPTIGADFNLASFIKLNLSLGYRKGFGLDLAGLKDDDFDGFTGSVNVKFGRFNRMKK